MTDENTPDDMMADDVMAEDVMAEDVMAEDVMAEDVTPDETMLDDRDVVKSYSLPDFVAELRRLADALESGTAFEIEIEGETVVVPEGAMVCVEHEREDGQEELEFQIVWGAYDDEEDDGDEEMDEDESEEDPVSA